MYTHASPEKKPKSKPSGTAQKADALTQITSEYSFGNVRVGYNLDKPMQLQTNKQISKIIQRVITVGQSDLVRLYYESHRKILDKITNPDTLVKHLRWFIADNRPSFTNCTTQPGIKTHITDITTELGQLGYALPNNLAHSIQNARELEDIIGELVSIYGIVPASTVATIKKKYDIGDNIIQNALDQIAAAQGGVGVKIFQTVTKHKKYTAELKIQAMGGDRIYSRSPVAPRVFSIIGKHT